MMNDDEPYNSEIDSDVDDVKENNKPEDSDNEDSDNESTKPPPPVLDDRDDTDDEDDYDDMEEITNNEFEEELNEEIKPGFTHDDLYNADDDEYDTDDDDDDNLTKLDTVSRQDIITNYHPELKLHNSDEIDNLCRVVRDDEGVIIDPLHRTIPIVTRYEKARILGERAKQINAGSSIFVNVDNSVIDGYLIALKEFEAKKIPLIVKRPMPNGGCEYWKLEDLEIL